MAQQRQPPPSAKEGEKRRNNSEDPRAIEIKPRTNKFAERTPSESGPPGHRKNVPSLDMGGRGSKPRKESVPAIAV